MDLFTYPPPDFRSDFVSVGKALTYDDLDELFDAISNHYTGENQRTVVHTLTAISFSNALSDLSKRLPNRSSVLDEWALSPPTVWTQILRGMHAGKNINTENIVSTRVQLNAFRSAIDGILRMTFDAYEESKQLYGTEAFGESAIYFLTLCEVLKQGIFSESRHLQHLETATRIRLGRVNAQRPQPEIEPEIVPQPVVVPQPVAVVPQPIAVVPQPVAVVPQPVVAPKPVVVPKPLAVPVPIPPRIDDDDEIVDEQDIMPAYSIDAIKNMIGLDTVTFQQLQTSFNDFEKHMNLERARDIVLRNHREIFSTFARQFDRIYGRLGKASKEYIDEARVKLAGYEELLT